MLNCFSDQPHPLSPPLFITPLPSTLRVRIRGLEMLVFRKILGMYLMDDP